MVINDKLLKRLSDIKLKYYLNVTNLKIKEVEFIISKYADDILYSSDACPRDHQVYNIYKELLIDLMSLKSTYEEEIHCREVSDKNLEEWIND